MNADQATFLTEYFANMMEQERRTTVKIDGGSADEPMQAAG